VTITFVDNDFVSLRREEGHLYLFSQLFHEGGDGEPADVVRIPGLKILNKLVTDVPVLIPHRKYLTQEVLGLNVLEYFNYYVDTENTRLYMKLNPSPNSYDPMVACGKIFTITPNEKTALPLTQHQ